MKPYYLLIIVAFILFGCKTIANKKNEQSLDNMTVYSIEDGNQDDLIYYVEVTQTWLDSIQSKYNWDNYDVYDNRMWEYMYKFLDEMVKNCDAKDNTELWNNLTREQKVFWSFLSFNGDTDNGGVYQFFFNRPQHSLAVLESWHELRLESLETDYKAVLDELVGKKDELIELKAIFNNENLEWEKRWEAFNNGYQELPTASKIEDYYYNPDFKKHLYKTVADYVESNMNSFAVIK